MHGRGRVQAKQRRVGRAETKNIGTFFVSKRKHKHTHKPSQTDYPSRGSSSYRPDGCAEVTDPREALDRQCGAKRCRPHCLCLLVSSTTVLSALILGGGPFPPMLLLLLPPARPAAVARSRVRSGGSRIHHRCHVCRCVHHTCLHDTHLSIMHCTITVARLRALTLLCVRTKRRVWSWQV